MKTFEEYQFRVKHSAISADDPIPIKELKQGDWFYFIADNYMNFHAQVSRFNYNPHAYYVILHYINQNNDDAVVSFPNDNVAEKKKFWVNKYTIHTSSFILTTSDEEAQEYLKDCKKPLQEFPLK